MVSDAGGGPIGREDGIQHSLCRLSKQQSKLVLLERLRKHVDEALRLKKLKSKTKKDLENTRQWTFAEPIEIIEMQLEGADTSRNVWIVVHDERAYLPANLGFPPGKNWHLAADQDGAAQLRIETRLYDVALRRISDAAQSAQVFASLEAKYPSGAPEGVQYWFFAVDPR